MILHLHRVQWGSSSLLPMTLARLIWGWGWGWGVHFQDGSSLVLAVTWELSGACLLEAFNGPFHLTASVSSEHGYWDSEGGMPVLRDPECYLSAVNWTKQWQAQIRLKKRRHRSLSWGKELHACIRRGRIIWGPSLEIITWVVPWFFIPLVILISFHKRCPNVIV